MIGSATTVPPGAPIATTSTTATPAAITGPVDLGFAGVVNGHATDARASSTAPTGYAGNSQSFDGCGQQPAGAPQGTGGSYLVAFTTAVSNTTVSVRFVVKPYTGATSYDASGPGKGSVISIDQTPYGAPSGTITITSATTGTVDVVFSHQSQTEHVAGSWRCS